MPRWLAHIQSFSISHSFNVRVRFYTPLIFRCRRRHKALELIHAGALKGKSSVALVSGRASLLSVSAVQISGEEEELTGLITVHALPGRERALCSLGAAALSPNHWSQDLGVDTREHV